ncbi:hypothetical protein ACIQU6_34985 [Streptomyces sp. NPDC090442]|uniref:hypothetical protein n=1 Tax=Streptomyces sp. NPDC090442 TaxID=3365962 RepID=UPI0037FE9B65
MKTTDEMRTLFDKWAKGQKRVAGSGEKIPDRFITDDKTMIQWRTESDSGGATIDIFPSNPKSRAERHLKVHLPIKKK